MKTIAARWREAFFYPRPLLVHPAADRGFVALDRATRRLLRGPAQIMQQAPHMIDVIVHVQPLRNDLSHARTGPQIGVKARGLCALEQQRLQPALVFGRQLRWPSRGRPGVHSGLTPASRRRLPASHAAAIHADSPRHFHRQQSITQQRQRAQASSLQFLWASRRSHRTPPTHSIGHYLCSNQ